MTDQVNNLNDLLNKLEAFAMLRVTLSILKKETLKEKDEDTENIKKQIIDLFEKEHCKCG